MVSINDNGCESMDEKDFEDSPFYVKYTGEKTTNVSFKHSKSFKKALEKHLRNKFDSDNFGACLRYIVEDYLQHQCLEQKLFQKTIVAIAKKSQIDNGISLRFLFVKDGYTQYYQDEFDKGIHGGVKFIQVHQSSIIDYIDNNLMTKNEHDLIKSASEHYINEFVEQGIEDDVVVCEIPLNNWLDSYDDGVYGLRADKNVHLGVNIINTNEKAFGIIYRWFFATDINGNEFIKVVGGSVETYDCIGIFDRNLVLRELSKYNKDKYNAFKHVFESFDLSFPQNSFDRLVKKYESKLKEKELKENDLKFIDEDIARMESKLKSFGYLE